MFLRKSKSYNLTKSLSALTGSFWKLEEESTTSTSTSPTPSRPDNLEMQEDPSDDSDSDSETKTSKTVKKSDRPSYRRRYSQSELVNYGPRKGVSCF